MSSLVALAILVLINSAQGHFGGGPLGGYGGPPDFPKGPPPKWPPPPPMKGPGKGWFDWFKWGPPSEKCEKDAKELGITPPPFTPPPPMPFVDFVPLTVPLGPTFDIVKYGGNLPPSLVNIDKSKCVCDLFTNVVQTSAQLDINALAMK